MDAAADSDESGEIEEIISFIRISQDGVVLAIGLTGSPILKTWKLWLVRTVHHNPGKETLIKQDSQPEIRQESGQSTRLPGSWNPLNQTMPLSLSYREIGPLA